ncbi:MAG: DUF5615 family PIN-like protein [Actinomycetota bacterium]|nr:DUF5615 family PIN-like protein [Actinomycetota bacterium]
MYPVALAAGLREKGRDVVAVLEVDGLSASPDSDVLEWATRHQRAVVTENVGDFARLSLGPHAGIILVRARKWPRSGQGLGRLVAALDGRLSAEIPVSTDAAEWL